MRTFPNPLRVALVGCGDIGPSHARSLSAATHAKLVMCMDVVESSAKKLGEEFGVPSTTRLEEVLANPEVDLLTLATPAFTRRGITEAAAKVGKAVLCEKPIAPTLEDVDAMIQVCKQAGVPLAMNFPMRYGGASVWARELIRAGALGRIIGMRLCDLCEKKGTYWTGGYSGRTQTDWRKSKQASGGGVIITNLIHQIDAIRGITGLEVARAWGEAGTFATEVEVEDLASATLRYENGAIAVLHGSSIYWGGDTTPWPVVILGEKGQIRFGGGAEVYLLEAAAGLPACEWVSRTFDNKAGVDLYEDLATALQADGKPPLTGEDGRAALEIVLAIYRSASSGQPVRLPLG